MSNLEKIKLIEDALELSEGSLSEETKLSDVSAFDSMGKLTLIVLCDDEFSKKLTTEQLNKFITVGDVLAFMD